MTRNAFFIFLLTCFAAFSAHAQTLSDKDYLELEREQEFNRNMDAGLSAFVNAKDYESAVYHFENALKVKPRDPTARKSLRLARQKVAKIAVEGRAIPEPTVPGGIPQPRKLILPDTVEKVESGINQSSSTDPSMGWISTDDPASHANTGWISTEDPQSHLKDEKIENIRKAEEIYREAILDFMEENYPETIKKVGEVLKIDPDHPKAKKLLMRAYSRQK